eukprot:6474406-Alexandrium_andersonii.AAC.1
MAAAPAGSSAAAAPEPSNVAMRPVGRAGPSKTARLASGRGISPLRTGCVAASSAARPPHRHHRTRHDELAWGRRT